MKKVFGCWPKPKVGKVKVLKECDLQGGVGPVPVYPVTSTKAVFNTKNIPLEELIEEGIKFQDELWVQKLWVKDIIPYIADGDRAEGKPYYELDTEGALNYMEWDSTENLWYKAGTVLTSNKFGIAPPTNASQNGTLYLCGLTFGHENKTIDIATSYEQVLLPKDNTDISTIEIFKINDVSIYAPAPVELPTFTQHYTDTDGEKLFTYDGITIHAPKFPEIPEIPTLVNNTDYTEANGVLLFEFGDVNVYGPKPVVNESEESVISLSYTQHDGDTTSIGRLTVNEKTVDIEILDSLLTFEPLYTEGTPVYIKNGVENWNLCFPKITAEILDGNVALFNIQRLDNGIMENLFQLKMPVARTSGTSGYVYVNMEEWDETMNAENYLVHPDGSYSLITTNSGSSNVVISANTSDTSYYLTGVPEENSGEDTVNFGIVNGGTTAIFMTPSTGSLTAAAFYQTSDINIKENIKDIDIPFEQILQLPTIFFNYKDSDKINIGTIAQEVEKVCPEIVTENNGIKAVDYAKLSVLALKGLKDLNKRVSELESLIDKIIGD